MSVRNYNVCGEWLVPNGRKTSYRKIKSKKYAHVHRLRLQLIQGYRRKICVMWFDSFSDDITDTMVLAAAAHAQKKGWKKVVILQDFCVGDQLEAFNMNDYHNGGVTNVEGFFLGALSNEFKQS